jgi:hypothetical protein
MKLFNLDLHISVIGDIKNILTDLGHEVTSWNMSGHNWVFGRSKTTTDVITQENWYNINEEMCDAFYNRYKNELNQYDAFLTTHPPIFSRLFKNWNKPIIMVASIRYECPFSTRPKEWEKFNTFLREGVDKGQITLIANSKYDAEYGKYFLDREFTHIPNLCEYTGVNYSPNKDKFLYYSRFMNYGNYCNGQIPNLIEKSKALGHNYQWSDVVKYKGIVGVPYNVSTMSIFEYYTQNIPMFFPSVDLMIEMKKNHGNQILGEVTWNETWNLKPEHYPTEWKEGSVIKPGPDDPNHYQDLNKFKKWLPLADFYDTEWMPHIQYFNSWDELKNRLSTIKNDELMDISNNMKTANNQRKQKVYDKWKKVMSEVNL